MHLRKYFAQNLQVANRIVYYLVFYSCYTRGVNA